MKRKLAIVFTAFFLAAGAVHAVHAGAATKDETTLEHAATDIDDDAGKREKPVVQRIESEFKVTDAQINDLRTKQKLGYGEISIVFAMAEKLPGGITDANVDRIMAMRNGPPKMGWGEISQKLGLGKLGPIISSVERVRKEERQEMKKEEKMEMKEKMEKGGMGEKPEHPGRPERPEVPERPERPERPMR